MLARLLRTLARLSPTGVSDDGPGAAPRAATNGDPSPGTDGTGFGVASASQRADDESDASPELRRSLSFLDLSVDAGTVVEAGYGAAVVISVALAPTVLLAPPAFRPAAVLFVLVAALGVTHAVH
ncbi:hypothetical protein ACFQDG_19405, partial [Natronoarchaeum mannanilyticum]